MNELEMSDSEARSPKNIEELTEYIDSLVNQPQSYGTCVYAMSLASVATFNYVADRLGVTGFQASCADLDFIKRVRGLKHGFRIVDYGKLLYPQYYDDDDSFPTAHQLLMKNLEQLQDEALDLIEEDDKSDLKAHLGVRKHWEWIISLHSLESKAKKEGNE